MSNTAPDTADFFELYKKESAEHKPKQPGFTKLPDGRYKATREIHVETVKNTESPNYGRTKIVITLKVNTGEQAGKTAYFHHVLQPADLDKPASASKDIQENWLGKMKAHVNKTRMILSNAGVETVALSIEELVRNIAHSNAMTIITDFTMKNGVPLLNSSEIVQSTDLPELWATDPGDMAPFL